jgi:pimeloyl-ACP methyl ester carboxylesterase
MRRFLAGVLCAAAGMTVALAPARSAPAADPPYDVPADQLAAALDCPQPFTHPEHEPVLLVHGTFTNGHENFSWNWELLLPTRGFDYCVVTYPDRGLGDMQVAAEYVAYAVQRMAAMSGRKVDIVGHSQGGLMPRWAIKWWPSVQALVDDDVMLAGPNHGVGLAANAEQSPVPLAPVMYQFSPTSNFIRALNADDESPGPVDYTSLYSLTDELVQPAAPVPTAALEWGRTEPNVRNVLLQDVCPGRLVDHLSIGTTDRLAQELALDALSHPGPADPSRLALPATCALPDQYVVPDQFPVLLEQFQRSMAGGFPSFATTDTEPAIKAYATGSAAPATTTTTAAGAVEGNRSNATLPSTGGGPPLALGLGAIALGLLVRTRKR